MTPARRTAPPHSLVLACAASVLAVVGCLLVLPAAAASGVSDVAQGVAALCAAASTAGHGRRTPDARMRVSWGLVAAGCASWAAGEAYWCAFTLRGVEGPFPSWADVGFLTFALLMAAAWLVHPAQGGRTGFAQRALDGLMCAGAVGLISWLTTLGVVADSSAGTGGLEYVLLLAYPSADVLLVVLTVLVLARPGGGQPVLHLLATGVVALGVSDSAFAYLAATGAYDGGLLDAGWIVGFALIALAGAGGAVPADPGRCTLGRPEPAEPASEREAVPSLLPYVPVLAALTIVAGVSIFVRPLSRGEMIAACGVVLCLLARQYLAVADNARLARALTVQRAELRRQVFTDPLTGLANRALFTDRLAHALALHARDGRPTAVVYLDLDGFKAVNDTGGHAAGDALLRDVADRLRAATRDADTVARLGGDEFAVLLEDATDPMGVAARLRAALDDRGSDPTGVAVRASIGVAAVDADEAAVIPDVLLARADAAMYAAKRDGRRTGRTTIAGFDLRAAAAVTAEAGTAAAR